jgi:hypothetical protein
MTFYCNDCGGAFDPATVCEWFPDGVGRCKSCIHESGDCPQHDLPMGCGPCKELHERHVAYGEASPYCFYCARRAA